MRTRTPQSRRPTVGMESESPRRIAPEEGADALARRLLRSLYSEPGAASSPPGIFLDVTVAGFRCTVRKLPPPEDAAIAALSPREQEIARMVARGYPNKTIAAVLEISVWTVGTYLRRIFAKLGVASRAAMVAKLGSDGHDSFHSGN
ncbi:MAG TPA: helix-turn-helix transcriptional regulator [Planctomycetia bacterium]|nr:helix-turn-helix transcriptional regulator [Planctomycetia bacterium]